MGKIFLLTFLFIGLPYRDNQDRRGILTCGAPEVPNQAKNLSTAEVHFLVSLNHPATATGFFEGWMLPHFINLHLCNEEMHMRRPFARTLASKKFRRKDQAEGCAC